MKDRLFYKKYARKLLFTLPFILLYVHAATLTAAQSQQPIDWLEKVVNVQFHNESLSSVLNKITNQTGIVIFYDKNLADTKVTGSYNNTTVTEAINRLFGDQNKSIQISQTKKIIIVKTFGAQQFIWSNINQVELTNNDKTSSSITLAELVKLHAKQYKEYKRSISNDNEFLNDEGMTRGELRAMQEKQYKEYIIASENDNQFLDEVGMTRGELRAMQEKQYKEHLMTSENVYEFLEDEEMTRGELRAMQDEQYKKYLATNKKDDMFLEDEGMTRNELRAMQKKQFKAYKDKQKNPARIIVYDE